MSEGAGASTANAAPPTQHGLSLPFEFTGSTREYFGIWLVNTLLTLLTCGVYSAWAKVQTRQYFYRNTWLAGASFEYSANPWRILRGRALIALVLGAVIGAKYYALYVYAGPCVALALLAPWALVQALAFNARNSSHRGLPFAFVGSTKASYWAFLRAALSYSCGLGYPYGRHRLTQFVTTGHRYGDKGFTWSAGADDYYPVYVLALALLFPAVMLLLFGIEQTKDLPNGATLVSLLFYAYLLVPTAFLKVNLANLLYGQLHVGPHRFASSQTFGALLKLYTINLLAITLSAGLLIPWARIRLARYRARCLAFVPHGEIEVSARRAGSGGALGDAATDIGGLDLDLGL